MKKVIFIAAALFALAACNKEVISSPEEGYGILKLSVESDDRVVVNTKADPVYDVNTDEFNVTIINDEGETFNSVKLVSKGFVANKDDPDKYKKVYCALHF